MASAGRWRTRWEPAAVPGMDPAANAAATTQLMCPSAQWVARVGTDRAAMTTRLVPAEKASTVGEQPGEQADGGGGGHDDRGTLTDSAGHGIVGQGEEEPGPDGAEDHTGGDEQGVTADVSGCECPDDRGGHPAVDRPAGDSPFDLTSADVCDHADDRGGNGGWQGRGDSDESGNADEPEGRGGEARSADAEEAEQHPHDETGSGDLGPRRHRRHWRSVTSARSVRVTAAQSSSTVTTRRPARSKRDAAMDARYPDAQ